MAKFFEVPDLAIDWPKLGEVDIADHRRGRRTPLNVRPTGRVWRFRADDPEQVRLASQMFPGLTPPEPE